MIRHRQMTLDDYLNIARRRWWLIFLPGVLGLGIAFGISFFLPYRYDSQSLILVDQQRVSNTLVAPVVTMVMGARLATIEEQVLSRTRLQPLIDKYGLFKSSGNGQALPDEMYDDTRAAISVKPVESVMSGTDSKSEIPGFYIRFTYRDPRVAQQVCEELTSMFIDQDLRFREQAAQGTTNFLQSQLDDAKRKLDEQEARLAQFKRKYLGALPDDTQSNLNVLTSLGTQLDSVMGALNRTQQDKVYTESLLQQQLQAWQKPSADAPPPQTLDQQLATLEGQLTDLQIKDTPEHPDVVRMKAIIAELKEKVAQAHANPKGSSLSKGEAADTHEPILIQQLRSQLQAEDEAIQAQAKEQERINNQIKVYEGRIQMSPAVEQEYKQISRDHETALQFYDSLLKKQNESEMAADLQRRQEGDQFRVLDAPSLPDKPSFPNRPILALQGLLAGLALGAGLVWGLEMSDDTLRTERDVESLLLLPTLAMVPVIIPGKLGKEKHETKNQQGSAAVTPAITV